MRSCVFACLVVVCYAEMFMVDPGPLYPPTKGEVWPKPQYEEKENILYKFDKAQFNFKVIGETCVILLAAVVRYEKLLHQQQDATRAIRRELLRRNMRRRSRSFVTGLLQDINIELTKPCEAYPHLGMDESYNLTVEAESHLKSASIWGILRGLETFAQLFYPSENYNVSPIDTKCR
ncbi:beta-hexosaminidase subunit alpha-like [Choristoneura fumiferana]|uniref:beta-hexosaminidase subunit alpha-like n=1 Tax=Choristoneura fumiferana TaxID=7141 RepID=UPI003D15B98B